MARSGDRVLPDLSINDISTTGHSNAFVGINYGTINQATAGASEGRYKLLWHALSGPI